MTNHTRKLLSLALGCSLGICFTSQVSAATFNVSTSGDGTITLTSADDNLSITGTGGEISYSLGDESGILSGVRRLSIVARGGDNVISLEQLQLEQDLTIRVADGADDISVTDSDIGRRLSIVTAGGADNIELDNVTVEGRVTVVTSAGSDTVNLNGNTFNNVLSVNTGGNDDELTATGNLGSLRTMLNGSGGRGDVYRQDETNVFGSPFVFRGFETEEIVETEEVLLGDVDLSGVVDFADIAVFNEILSAGAFQAEADCDENGMVDFLDREACDFPTFEIGDTGPGGGIVFSVSADGLTGLEAAPEDQSDDVVWCLFFDIAGVDNIFNVATPDPNSGAHNTPLIAAACGSTSAAAVAAAYEWPNDQIDGFLPNKEELVQMYRTIGPGCNISDNPNCDIGGFANDRYWSSSEIDNLNAWGQNFLNGNQLDFDKANAFRVRAVRAF